MSGKQTMVWNGEADAKLLLAILKVSDVKVNYEAVAKEFTTDVTTCTPRAVQEHLKKLRKIAQGDAGPTTPSKSNNTTSTTTPVKTSRKKGVATPTGVKKTRKPAVGGKGKKGKAADVDDDEDGPAKMESDSDDGDHEPTSKKRKHDDITDDSGNVGEEVSVVKSEPAEDPAQNDFDELLAA